MKIMDFLPSIPVLFGSFFSQGHEAALKVAKGYEVAQHINEFGQLRLDYFRGYPYFYDGDPVSEREYLQNYASNSKTLLVLSQKGALMGCPLADTLKYHHKPFWDNNMPVDEMYYLGELVFEPGEEQEERQAQMYQKFEEEVRKMGYRQIALYEIVTDENDPRAPEGYVSIERLWEKMGFVKMPQIVFEALWEEQGKEKAHHLIAWVKNI